MSGCGHPYKMQSPAELARPENPTPKWPVPQDLIELQPSYAQVTIRHPMAISRLQRYESTDGMIH